MDKKDTLHIIATLTRLIGEEKMLEELNAIGWRGIESHPVEFFQGYISELDGEFEQERIELITSDLHHIGRQYGYKLEGDEFVSIASL